MTAGGTTMHGGGTAATAWYKDWQSAEHAAVFDSRRALGAARLIRNYESFNDVRLIHEWLARPEAVSLVELGCATAEFYRYVRVRHPQVRYYGLDVSRAAIARAKAKYPQAQVFVCEPEADLAQTFRATLGLAGLPGLVYAKDVMHHQTDPLGFVSRLLRVASEMVVVRTRTRDVGATVSDPEMS